ncbi:DUF485 domain-containing protein [Solicola sp. PLA-1-18]|uniref:DUF485 domain-containing protein n=1 Tax=Solicola sp. PLA-1-18 TaxID=3380532 RepID=UPI003B7CDE95
MVDRTSQATHDAYERIHAEPEFTELKRRFVRFVVPTTIAFMVWYLLFVVLSNWAPGFMSTPVFGNINVALLFGLLQFVSTFGIAIAYARFANSRLDPLSTRLRDGFDQEVGK